MFFYLGVFLLVLSKTPSATSARTIYTYACTHIIMMRAKTNTFLTLNKHILIPLQMLHLIKSTLLQRIGLVGKKLLKMATNEEIKI